MNVVALQFSNGLEVSGSQLYRQNIPLYQLGRHGNGTRILPITDLITGIQVHGQVVMDMLIEDTDVFIFPRVQARQDVLLTGLQDIVRQIRARGKHIVYEVDDDFSQQYRDVGAYRSMEIASWCDAITVTTPYLARTMKQTGRPVYVLPNMLDPSLWRRTEVTPERETLTIGLSGSPTHEKDWQVMADVVPRILANTYEQPVEFRIMGFVPEWARELPVTLIPGMDYAPYAEQVRDFDIVLAPVDPEDKFNLGKSPIKVIEGMGAKRRVYSDPHNFRVGGSACIATDNEVYRLAITQGKTGLLCSHNAESWYTAIDSLLRNKVLRNNLQTAGYTWAWKRHDITQTWVQWRDAYQSILRRPPLS